MRTFVLSFKQNKGFKIDEMDDDDASEFLDKGENIYNLRLAKALKRASDAFDKAAEANDNGEEREIKEKDYDRLLSVAQESGLTIKEEDLAELTKTIHSDGDGVINREDWLNYFKQVFDASVQRKMDK